MSSSPNSLVMGVAAGYKAEQILPFLKSLRQTDYQGKVCLFVSNLDETAVTQIRAYAEEVVSLDGLYREEIDGFAARMYVATLRWVRVTRRVRRLYPMLFKAGLRLARPPRRKKFQFEMEQYLEGYQALRYFHYLDYIQTEAPDADYIMLTDVRDVIFQGDPFERIGDELQVFLEAQPTNIGSEAFNSRWIRDLYGNATLAELSEETVSCSGTTMGTRSHIVRYLTEMTGEIARQTHPLGSHDQAVHNYLLRKERLAPVTICSNGEGAVMTLGKESDVRLDAGRRILDRKGCVSPVVHQYDRHPGLADEILARFA